MTRKFDRRKFLVSAGATGSLFLAGCLGGDDGGDGTTEGTDGGGGGATTGTGTGTESMGNETGTDGGGGGPGGATDRTLSLGVLMPTTGDLANLGQPIRDGAILPQAQLDGNTTFTIDVQEADTQTDANAGQAAAENLVNAGYPMVTGAASSAVTIQAAQNVFIPNSVVACSPASTSPAITDLQDSGLIYRTPPSDALQGPVLAQVAADNQGASSASTLFINNDYGQALSEAFAGAFEENGGTVQQQVSFTPGQSSYTSRLQQALGDSPDLMLIIGYPESGVQIFRDFYSSFNQPDLPILVTDGLRSESLPADVGNEMANVQGTAPLASGPGNDFFTQLYNEEYGRAPGVFNAHAYDASACLLIANAAAGANDGAAIAEQMQPISTGGEEFGPETLAEALEAAASGTDVNYQGASSAVEFDEAGDLAAVTYELFGWTESGDTESGYAIETLEEIEAST
ncbi:ABC transporter substrate-binding protein [Halomarina rubra]|uniref:ABC transporter substrate-binding protein n=1 Tax=Halomarina rubra TaxID=2071873 RepID=A0ABD6AZ20_9EURY|nr:ABC transporter substrate-binding protein [Halomarina rubra]